MNAGDIDALQREITEKADELSRIAREVACIPKQTYTTKFTRGFNRFWSGGILQAVSDGIEQSRVGKILESPFYKDTKYGSFPGFVFGKLAECIEIQKKIQALISKDDDRYYANIDMLHEVGKQCIDAWGQHTDVSRLTADKGIPIYHEALSDMAELLKQIDDR